MNDYDDDGSARWASMTEEEIRDWGKPGAAEAVAGAHAAVAATHQATRHDATSASVSDLAVEYQDHTQDAGAGR